MLPEAHLLDRQEQMFRDLLIQRVKLGVEIGRLKSSVISYLKREGVYQSLPESSDNFSSARRHAILSLSFGDTRDLAVKTMMERIGFMEGQRIPLETSIRKFAPDNEDVKILMTIPGVDYYLASLMCSYIGGVNRFHFRPTCKFLRNHPGELGQRQHPEEGEDVEGRTVDREVGPFDHRRYSDIVEREHQGVL
jgi:hypothetical protein